MPTPAALLRRARPMLGTLLDVGADTDAFEAAFGAVLRVQRCMSRFDAGSDIARFNAMRAGESIELQAETAEVLAAASALRDATEGLFDVSTGTGPRGWTLEGRVLRKTHEGTSLDLGGIAKGYAVDRAVQALQAAGASRGWVNAGGDLRVFGDIELPVQLRDEQDGGTRPFGHLAEGAMATSHFGVDTQSRHAQGAHAHVTVMAPLCLWADALTKVMAAGEGHTALLARYQAQAWRH